MLCEPICFPIHKSDFDGRSNVIDQGGNYLVFLILSVIRFVHIKYFADAEVGYNDFSSPTENHRGPA